MKPKKYESLDEEFLNYTRQIVKPASYEELDKAIGSLTKNEADELREEVRRSRKDDWR